MSRPTRGLDSTMYIAGQNVVLSRACALSLAGCLLFGCSQENSGSEKDEESEPSKKDDESENAEQSPSEEESDEEDDAEESDDQNDSSGDEGNEDDSEPNDAEMNIKFTTVSPDGKYAPRNVGAVWVEDKAGKYVRTIKVWAKKRERHLVQWQKASDGDRTDAVSGATIKSHKTHSISWDLKDLKGKRVKPGSYVLRFEITDKNSSSKSIEDGPDLSIPFELGDDGSEVDLPKHENFKDLELKLPESDLSR